jgi:hypothetical protein
MKQPSPKLKYIGGDYWLLIKDYKITVNYKKTSYTFVVKKDFIFDGATIPRLGRIALDLSKTGKLDKMSLIHDALYVVKGQVRIDSKIINVYVDGENINKDFSRLECDKIMKIIMLEDVPEELNKRQVFLIHSMVVLLGWTKWMKPKKEESYFLVDQNDI